jgi:hypothetical protein
MAGTSVSAAIETSTGTQGMSHFRPIIDLHSGLFFGKIVEERTAISWKHLLGWDFC